MGEEIIIKGKIYCITIEPVYNDKLELIGYFVYLKEGRCKEFGKWEIVRINGKIIPFKNVKVAKETALKYIDENL